MSIRPEIFADFDHARQGKITSADIEHEAHRYLRERFEGIQKRPEDAFTISTDKFGNEYPRGGEGILPHLYDDLENEVWPEHIEVEARDVARR